MLALDDTVLNFFKNKERKNVVLHSINDVEKDFEIRSLKYSEPGQEAISNASASGKDPKIVQFCWSLAPCFSMYIMDRLNESVTYIDADILVLSDLSHFLSELSTYSIGIVRHRIDYLYTSGEFNVGIVHFENDMHGRSGLRFWKRMMLNPRNQYSLGFGTCGDQKYLELINSLYRKNVKIVDDSFGHLAPWNVTFHKYAGDKVIWNGVEQEVFYFHFAHFVMEEGGKYRASYNNEWIWGDPLGCNEYVKTLYDEYNSRMLSAKQEIFQ